MAKNEPQPDYREPVLPPDRPKTGTRVYEPHAWNAKIVAKQKARGEPRNLPMLPDAVRRTHIMTDKAPKLRDPKRLAAQKPGPALEMGGDGNPEELQC